MREAADTLKRLTFELGGKSPNVILEDADLDAAAAGTDFGLFFNQGQCCCAGSRVFVQDSIHDEFVASCENEPRLANWAILLHRTRSKDLKSIKLSSTKSCRTSRKVTSKGAKCETGGARFGDRGYFVQPTIFSGVNDSMAIAQEEIFGPVMSVLKFSDWDELIQRANQTFYGLAAAVWTRNVHKLMTSRDAFGLARFGSTATTCSMQRLRLAVSKCLAKVANWAKMVCVPTSKPKR